MLCSLTTTTFIRGNTLSNNLKPNTSIPVSYHNMLRSQGLDEDEVQRSWAATASYRAWVNRQLLNMIEAKIGDEDFTHVPTLLSVRYDLLRKNLFAEIKTLNPEGESSDG